MLKWRPLYMPCDGPQKLASHVRCAQPSLALTESRFSPSLRTFLWLSHPTAAGDELPKLTWCATDALAASNDGTTVTPRCEYGDRCAHTRTRTRT